MQLPVLLMMKARRVRARCAKGGPTDAPHDRPDGQELQLLLLSTRHKYVQHKLQAQCLEIYRGQRVGLSLLQQLAVCASMHGVAQSEEMFSELLRLSKALSANSAASKVPDIDTSKQLPAGSKPLPQPVTGIFQQPGRAQVQRGTREHSKSDGQAGAGQKRAHDGDRSSGQPLFCVKVANGRQKPVPGHTKKGQRLRPAVMQVQVLRILSVFLSIPKPPTSSIVTVITTQHARLQQLLSTFNAFLFDEEAEGALLKHSLCAPDSKPPSSLILVDIIVPMHCVWLSTSLQLPGLYRFVVADVHHAF